MEPQRHVRRGLALAKHGGAPPKRNAVMEPHWNMLMSLHIAEMVTRAGAKLVVIAGIRSPFSYYVSHYRFALKDWMNGRSAGGLSRSSSQVGITNAAGASSITGAASRAPARFIFICKSAF